MPLTRPKKVRTENLSGTIPTVNLPTIPAANMPTGSIVQTVWSHITDAATYSSSGGALLDTAMTANITPISSSNKILVQMFGSWGAQNNAQHATQQIVRTVGSTNTTLDLATNKGNRRGSTGHFGAQESYSNNPNNYGLWPNIVCYLDSPATTSQVTYKVKAGPYGTGTFYFNRTKEDRNTANYDPRSTSFICLMEVVA